MNSSVSEGMLSFQNKNVRFPTKIGNISTIPVYRSSFKKMQCFDGGWIKYLLHSAPHRFEAFDILRSNQQSACGLDSMLGNELRMDFFIICSHIPKQEIAGSSWDERGDYSARKKINGNQNKKNHNRIGFCWVVEKFPALLFLITDGHNAILSETPLLREYLCTYIHSCFVSLWHIAETSGVGSWTAEKSVLRPSFALAEKLDFGIGWRELIIFLFNL